MEKAPEKNETQREEIEEIDSTAKQNLYITQQFLKEFSLLKDSYNELNQYVRHIGEHPETLPKHHLSDSEFHLAERSLKVFLAQASRRDMIKFPPVLNVTKS